MRKALLLIFTLGVIIFATFNCYPQGIVTPLLPQAGPAKAGTTYANPDTQRLIQLGLALLVPAIIAGFKRWVPEDKRKWLPIAAPILGELLAALATSLPHGSGAVAGAAGVGVREALDKGKRIGADAAAVLLLGCSLFFLSGCASAAGVARALAKDPAIVIVRMGTPWGNQQITRIGVTSNSVAVSPDGSVTVNGIRQTVGSIVTVPRPPLPPSHAPEPNPPFITNP